MFKFLLSTAVIAFLAAVPAAHAAPLPISAMNHTPVELDLSTSSLAAGVDFGPKGGDLTMFSLEVGASAEAGAEPSDQLNLFEGVEYLLRRVLAINGHDLIDRLRNLDLSR